MIPHNELAHARERLESWSRTMILSHDRPDGDALGSLGAMKRFIEAAGRQATAFIYESVPTRYQFLESHCGFTRWGQDAAATADEPFDGILIVDTCSWSQLEPAASFLRKTSLPKIVVDHHATRDPLSGEADHDIYLIDETAASAACLVYEWAEAMGWPIDAETAESLFAGIATDTGWFRFSNTDPRTLAAAARLIEAGVRPDVMHSRLQASHSPGRIRLLAEALATLELHADDRVALMSLTKEMFDRAGATKADTEDLINEPMSASSVLASVLLVDADTGEIRVSLRSKSPEVCGRDLDVAALASRFGGGGHRRAAGARVVGKLDAVREQVLTAVLAALD
jgi:phosphoesterase RecJ-like protein